MTPESPGDLVAKCQRLLDEHPELPIKDRAAFATVIASGGQLGGHRPTWGEVAEIIGEPAADCLQGLIHLRERNE